jgi:hypothetical protein
LGAQLWDIFYPNVPTREMTKQNLLEGKESYLREGALVTKKKGHNIADCTKEETSKQVCQNRIVRFGKLKYPISAENSRTSRQCNRL